MFTISVSLAVAAIPEGLPIIVTVTLALGVLRMASERAIVRRLPSVETLGSVDVICSDKTGTLTKNKLTLTKVWTVGMGPASSDSKVPKPWMSISENSDHIHIPSADITGTLLAASFCSHARISSETGKYFGNATDSAIMESLKRFDLEDIRASRHIITQVPFSSSRKWMWVASHKGDKNNTKLYCKGALDRILPMCTKYLAADGTTEVAFGDDEKIPSDKLFAMLKLLWPMKVLEFLLLLKAPDNLPSLQGEKGNDNDYTPSNLTFCGLIGMYDPPRPGVQNSIRRLLQGGVRIIMITGDNEVTAETIARKIGIPLMGDKAVMTGNELNNMSPSDLADCMSYVSVFARTSPEHKL